MQTKHLYVLVKIRNKGEVGTKTSLSPPVEVFLLTVPRRCFLCGSILLFMFRVCHAFLSVHCSLVVTCWESAGLLALLYMMLYCVFLTFPCGVQSKMWYVIAAIPDLYLLSYLGVGI